MSPTARSLKFLRELGYTAEVVERWIPKANVRKDLFGCIDIVAIHPERKETLGVQVTTMSHLSAREKKAKAAEGIAIWRQCGNKFELHGWAKRGNPPKWNLSIRLLPT